MDKHYNIEFTSKKNTLELAFPTHEHKHSSVLKKWSEAYDEVPMAREVEAEIKRLSPNFDIVAYYYQKDQDCFVFCWNDIENLIVILRTIGGCDDSNHRFLLHNEEWCVGKEGWFIKMMNAIAHEHSKHDSEEELSERIALALWRTSDHINNPRDKFGHY